jgi:hypothetical protein
VNPSLLVAFVYTIAFVVVGWWVWDDYIAFFGTARTHAVNFGLILGVTALVVALTWDLFLPLFFADRDQLPVRPRQAVGLILAYELVPCAIFVARYGATDLGGHELVRWPTALGGWTAAALASSYLLIIEAALR